jgi:hypothetical protein
MASASSPDRFDSGWVATQACSDSSSSLTISRRRNHDTMDTPRQRSNLVIFDTYARWLLIGNLDGFR